MPPVHRSDRGAKIFTNERSRRITTLLDTQITDTQTALTAQQALCDGSGPVTSISGTYYLHADHLGRPQFATDADGAVVWDMGDAVTPFGEGVNLAGAFAQKLMFPGQYADAETGAEITLSHNWHRTYDPTLGRYLQADPIGLAGGLNRFAFVGGNPMGFADFTGLLFTSTNIKYMVKAGCFLASNKITSAIISGAVGGAVSGGIATKTPFGAFIGGIGGGLAAGLTSGDSSNPAHAAIIGAIIDSASGGKFPGAVGGGVGGGVGGIKGAVLGGTLGGYIGDVRLAIKTADIDYSSTKRGGLAGLAGGLASAGVQMGLNHLASECCKAGSR